MIWHPKPDDEVQIWYRFPLRKIMYTHGRMARVVSVGRGRPRNHLVELIGETEEWPFVVVPAGNLRKPVPPPQDHGGDPAHLNEDGDVE